MDIKLEFLMGADAIVSSLSVKAGDQVKAGDELLQYEASKGILPILAPADGIVEEVLVDQGDRIVLNDVLVRMDTDTVCKEEEAGNRSTPVKKCREEKTDLLIIGAGPGGYEAAIYAAQNGLKVILAEAKTVGGTCLNEGCIPTKALNKGARTYQDILKAAKMGIEVPHPQINMPRLIEWKDEVRETLVSGILGLLKNHSVKLLTGTARFLSGNEVIVEQEEGQVHVSAANIIIATGSKSAGLRIPGVQLPQVMDSREALSLKKLPSSITIIGGGVIGMEFAFIYHSLGVSVQVIEYLEGILPMVDKDISGRLRLIAERKGILIQTGARVSRIENGLNQEAVVIYEKDGKEAFAVSEKVLMAVGRVPDYETLNIEAANIETRRDRRGIQVDGHMQTNRPGIYAIGDVNNILQLAHAASHQGMAAVRHILKMDGGEKQDIVPNVIFTMPEIASVGKTEMDCQKDGISYEVYKFPFSGNGKALIMGDTDGFVKLVKDRVTDEIIGGSIIGPDASTLINSITELVQFHIRQRDASEVIFPHPTTGEAISESILGLGVGALHSVNKKEEHIIHAVD